MYQMAIWRPLSPMPVRVSRMHPTIIMETVKTDPHLPARCAPKDPSAVSYSKKGFIMFP